MDFRALRDRRRYRRLENWFYRKTQGRLPIPEKGFGMDWDVPWANAKWVRPWTDPTHKWPENFPDSERYDIWLVKGHRRAARLIHMHRETGKWKYPSDSDWRDAT